jgi:hypothetical protein
MTQIVLEPMYETECGLEYMNPTDLKSIEHQIQAGKFRLAFHFQAVDCATIHGVTNKDKWNIDMTVYNYLQQSPYDKRTLLKLLVLGHFDIGVSRLGSYHLIREITPYMHDDNSELRMHYIMSRSCEGNVAWRSITWDLFEDMVDEMNYEAEINEKIIQRRYLRRMSTGLRQVTEV